MTITVLTFLAEPSAAPSLTWAPADRSAETMQRLRQPFGTPSERGNDDSMPGADR